MSVIETVPVEFALKIPESEETIAVIDFPIRLKEYQEREFEIIVQKYEGNDSIRVIFNYPE
jgi:hypothetical protein